MIFWLYFRQGMSTKEIASLPTIGLSTKGVGSVLERLKQGIREQILGGRSDSDDGESVKPKANSLENSSWLCGVSEHGPSLRSTHR